MDQFNVEDAFFGALLGAWCSKVGGFWADTIILMMLAFLFLMFGVTFRVVSGGYLLSTKVLLSLLSAVVSVLVIYYFYNTIEGGKEREIVFFAIIFAMWIIISAIKIIHHKLDRRWMSKSV